VIGAVSYYMFLMPKPAPPPNTIQTPPVTVVLYGGEVSVSKYGFGNSSSTITSPGPTLHFKTTDVVNMTFINIGRLPHAWVLKDQNSPTANTVFNAAIGSGSNPLTPGSKGSVIFTPNKAGTYYYLCPVPSHDDLGMYGVVIVS
jgi:plastocyanin